MNQKTAPTREYGAATKVVESLLAAGQLDDPIVRAFASDGKFEETVVSLSVLCRLSIDTIEGVLLEPSDAARALVIIRAAGLTWTTAKAILLFARRGRSPHDLHVAERKFEKLEVSTARQILRFQQARQW